MDNRDTNEIELTDSELARVSGGHPVLAGAAAVAVGVLAGFGAVQLIDRITAPTGTLNAGLHKN